MSKKTKKNSCTCPDRLGKVGGQAVLEGVMMKAGNRMVTTCRKPDGTLDVTDDNYVSARQKNKLLDLPLVRGVVSFVESMTMSFKTMGASANALGLEEEEPSKFEKWLAKTFKIKTTDAVMVVALVLGLGLSALLFIFLPGWVTDLVDYLLGISLNLSMPAFVEALVEGLIKVGIFVGYLVGVSFMSEIKRTFMYHGAEHKSIACFEAGEELTPENAKKYTRLHPRCGTSFMFFMILLGMLAGFVIKAGVPELVGLIIRDNPDLLAQVNGVLDKLYPIIRIAILPLLMGIGYEFIRFAGKHPSWFTRLLSAPGLWMQKITTKEPTEDMLEVAITSLKCALRDDYPEFREFYEAKAWEPAPAEQVQSEECKVQSDEDTAEPDCKGDACSSENEEDLLIHEKHNEEGFKTDKDGLLTDEETVDVHFTGSEIKFHKGSDVIEL